MTARTSVTCMRTSRRAFSVSSGRIKRLHAAHKKPRRKVRHANIEGRAKMLSPGGKRSRIHSGCFYPCPSFRAGSITPTRRHRSCRLLPATAATNLISNTQRKARPDCERGRSERPREDALLITDALAGRGVSLSLFGVRGVRRCRG